MSSVTEAMERCEASIDATGASAGNLVHFGTGGVLIRIMEYVNKGAKSFSRGLGRERHLDNIVDNAKKYKLPSTICTRDSSKYATAAFPNYFP